MNRAKLAAQRRGLPLAVTVHSQGVNSTPRSDGKPQKKPCGCDKRKAWLNKMIPGSGDLVEKFTEATGIKRLVQGPTESERATSDTAEARP